MFYNLFKGNCCHQSFSLQTQKKDQFFNTSFRTMQTIMCARHKGNPSVLITSHITLKFKSGSQFLCLGNEEIKLNSLYNF